METIIPTPGTLSVFDGCVNILTIVLGQEWPANNFSPISLFYLSFLSILVELDFYLN